MTTETNTKKNKVNLEKAYSIIKAPVVSEKSTDLTQYRQYSFDVINSATKKDVKNAVEAIFKVNVEKVNMLNRLGKKKRFRGRLGTTSNLKRTVVHLAEGQTIDIGIGL